MFFLFLVVWCYVCALYVVVVVFVYSGGVMFQYVLLFCVHFLVLVDVSVYYIVVVVVVVLILIVVNGVTVVTVVTVVVFMSCVCCCSCL